MVHGREKNVHFVANPPRVVADDDPEERLAEELDEDPAEVFMFEDELFESECDERELEEMIPLLLEGLELWLDCAAVVGLDGVTGVVSELEAGVVVGVAAIASPSISRASSWRGLSDEEPPLVITIVC